MEYKDESKNKPQPGEVILLNIHNPYAINAALGGQGVPTLSDGIYNFTAADGKKYTYLHRIQNANNEANRGRGIQTVHLKAIAEYYRQKNKKPLVHVFSANSANANHSFQEMGRQTGSGQAAVYCGWGNSAEALEWSASHADPYLLVAGIPTMHENGTDVSNDEIKFYIANLYFLLGQGKSICLPIREEEHGTVYDFGGGIKQLSKPQHEFIQAQLITLRKFSINQQADTRNEKWGQEFIVNPENTLYVQAFYAGQENPKAEVWMRPSTSSPKQTRHTAQTQEVKPTTTTTPVVQQTATSTPEVKQTPVTTQEVKPNGTPSLKQTATTTAESKFIPSIKKDAIVKALKEKLKADWEMKSHGQAFELVKKGDDTQKISITKTNTSFKASTDNAQCYDAMAVAVAAALKEAANLKVKIECRDAEGKAKLWLASFKEGLEVVDYDAKAELQKFPALFTEFQKLGKNFPPYIASTQSDKPEQPNITDKKRVEQKEEVKLAGNQPKR